MIVQTVTQIVPLLQTAIGPVILISGIGLLLLTMTNRYGRIIDRARQLVDSLDESPDDDKEKIKAQVRILWGRARLIRYVIAMASVSALTAAILIILLFVIALWQIEFAWILIILFILCMVSLIGSLVMFIFDINKSLAALKLELETEGINET